MKKFKYVALSFLALLGTASIISCGKKNNENNDKTSEKQIDKCVLTTINSDLFAGTITNYNNLKLNIGTEIILLATPQYGYSFEGWYYGEDKISDETNYRFTIYSDLELTAKWHMDFKTYALNTINVDTKGGSISDYQDQRLKEGDEVSVLASANEGYEFDGWYEGDDKVSDSPLYTFNIDHNTVLFVRWKKIQGETTKYTLTTINDNSNAGNITSYTNQEFDEGESVTLTANPKSGFEFDGWYNGDEKISSSSSYTFNINSNLVLTAKWISSTPQTTYTLTTINDNSNNGDITSFNNEKYNEGDEVTLYANPKLGYLFDGWYNGDEKISSSSSYTFNINSNLVLTAKWNENTHIAYKQEHFIYDDNDKNVIKGLAEGDFTEIVIPDGTTGIYDYAFNIENNFTAITLPSSIEWLGGFAFAKNNEINFYYDGTWIDYNNIYKSNNTAIPVGKNGGYVYFLDDNGTTLHNGKKYSLQTNIILPEGITYFKSQLFSYFNHLESLYIPSSFAGFDGGWQFFNSSLSKIYYKGTEENWNNIINNTQYNTYLSNDVIIYYYNENEPTIEGNYWHYVDEKITIWGQNSNPQTNKYTLTTINDNSNAGNITSYTNQEFDEGASVTLTANKNSGFEFDGWYNGDEKISSSSSYTFNINSNLVLTAKWITSSIPDTKYTLTTINDNSNAGNITSYTNQEFNSGASVTLTAEADFDYGYTFNGWYNGDEKISSSSSYTFNINSNLTLTAKWVYYTLTTTPCYNSSNDVPDGKQYYNIAGTFTILENEKISAGNTVTLVCVPKEESVTFVGWYKVNGSSMELLSTNQSYTYTMTEQDTIIRAKFLLYKYVENTNNKVIEYGFYPQSKVTDDEIKSELDNKIGNLPDAEHNYDWKNYNYYDDDTISNYMWYKDIDLDNDGVKDYRAVYFIKYRGSKTTMAASIGNSYVDDNGYELNKVYYFKFEPVLWDILETTTYGDTIIISRFIIDAQNWYINTSNRIDGLNTIYPTNYEESSIKNWLNNDFYDTVFDLYRHKNNSLNLTDNSVQSTGKTTNDYALDGIFSDKVYLMSVAEFNQYIKNNNTLKKASSTDYAKIQGLNVSTTSTTAGYSAYWTRSPQNSNINATNISNQGSTSSQVVTEIYGIRPLLDMFL
ncbi:MAG: InlB B-repeat-containing protein [Acholeplasmatales bacterium]|nr:InlB B-repeat-containing protein [Acholeplasmatales bacterium]